MANATYPAIRHVAIGNRFVALWDTVIGKKIVMAITGAVLILFVIAHMVGNLKIFAGSSEINTYARFLREAGTPALSLRTTALGRPNRPARMCGPSHHSGGPAQPYELGCATSWVSRQAQRRNDLRRADDALGRRAAGCVHRLSSSAFDWRRGRIPTRAI